MIHGILLEDIDDQWQVLVSKKEKLELDASAERKKLAETIKSQQDESMYNGDVSKNSN